MPVLSVFLMREVVKMDYGLLGQRIRVARLAAGLSQEQLAEMVGLTSQHISHTEVASTKISLPSLIKVANALHTSVDKLLTDNIYDSKPHLIDDVQAIFADCDPDEIYVMLEAATAVKKSIRLRKLKRTN
jgi:transcriptional regulator with XRE-family HTH domain